MRLHIFFSCLGIRNIPALRIRYGFNPVALRKNAGVIPEKQVIFLRGATGQRSARLLGQFIVSHPWRVVEVNLLHDSLSVPAQKSALKQDRGYPS